MKKLIAAVSALAVLALVLQTASAQERPRREEAREFFQRLRELEEQLREAADKAKKDPEVARAFEEAGEGRAVGRKDPKLPLTDSGGRGKCGMGILPMVDHGRDARATSTPMPGMAHRPLRQPKVCSIVPAMSNRRDLPALGRSVPWSRIHTQLREHDYEIEAILLLVGYRCGAGMEHIVSSHREFCPSPYPLFPSNGND